MTLTFLQVIIPPLLALLGEEAGLQAGPEPPTPQTHLFSSIQTPDSGLGGDYVDVMKEPLGGCEISPVGLT